MQQQKRLLIRKLALFGIGSFWHVLISNKTAQKKIANRKSFSKFQNKNLFLNKYCVKNHLTKCAIDVNKIVKLRQTQNSNGM